MTGRSYEVRSNQLLNELKRQKLEVGRSDRKVIFMYNVNRGLMRDSMSNTFRLSKNETYCLCTNALNYYLLKPNTNLLKKNVTHSAADN